MSAEGRANRRAFRGAGFREAASRARIVARTSSQAGLHSAEQHVHTRRVETFRSRLEIL